MTSEAMTQCHVQERERPDRSSRQWSWRLRKQSSISRPLQRPLLCDLPSTSFTLKLILCMRDILQTTLLEPYSPQYKLMMFCTSLSDCMHCTLQISFKTAIYVQCSTWPAKPAPILFLTMVMGHTRHTLRGIEVCPASHHRPWFATYLGLHCACAPSLIMIVVNFNSMHMTTHLRDHYAWQLSSNTECLCCWWLYNQYD